ncbi:hypothetical protein MBLNU230_g3919t1 [Neophaeotheca triangularis]
MLSRVTINRFPLRNTAVCLKADESASHSPEQRQDHQQGPKRNPKRNLKRIFSVRKIVLGGIAITFGAFCLQVYNGVQAAQAAQAAQSTSQLQHELVTLESACQELADRSASAADSLSWTHQCHLPANNPPHHVTSMAVFHGPSSWTSWSLFAGHGGPETAHTLSRSFPTFIAERLITTELSSRPYTHNNQEVAGLMKKAFVDFDSIELERAKAAIEARSATRNHVIADLAYAATGSSAIYAMYNSGTRALRVARLGDGQAVLGCWNAQSGSYETQRMSPDQTAFDKDAIARFKKEHSNEDVLNPETGRLPGDTATRAFGYARWKWPESLTRLASETFWGSAFSPNGAITSPPYVTAEPEVFEQQLPPHEKDPKNPNFLIIATKEFWDHVKSEDAVKLVDLWLQQNYSSEELARARQIHEKLDSIRNPFKWVKTVWDDIRNEDLIFKSFRRRAGKRNPDETAAVPLSRHSVETDVHPTPNGPRWTVSPEHFIVDPADGNCSTHLVRNALGGNRHDLFTGIMSMRPPHSAKFRDDLSVLVIFFGDYEDGTA